MGESDVDGVEEGDGDRGEDGDRGGKVELER